MKFKLLLAAFILALPAHAAVFISALTSGQAESGVLVFFVPGKTPRVINPETGQAEPLPAINDSNAEDEDRSPAN